MSPNEPTTPVRLPKAAATYSVTTQDPELRSQINTVLLRDGHISRIQDSLLHSLHASPTNWPTLIQQHALTLLRSGEIHTFPELMTQVLADIRDDSAVARAAESSSSPSAATNAKAGVNGTKGEGKAADGKMGNGNSAAIRGHGPSGASLAVPKSVLDEGVRLTRESLEQVCDIVE